MKYFSFLSQSPYVSSTPIFLKYANATISDLVLFYFSSSSFQEANTVFGLSSLISIKMTKHFKEFGHHKIDTLSLFFHPHVVFKPV